jgi:c(7)-type cytochrome triheme protein
MTRRLMLLAALLLMITPSALYARWIKDKIYLETKEVGVVAFSHANHLEAAGKNCQTCHNDIYHIVTKNNPAFTMSEMEAGKACGACHNGDKAFSVKKNCATCHGNGTIVYDTDAGKVSFSHDVHTGAFGCDSCHPSPFKAQRGSNTASMAQMEKGASCGACHDGSTAFGVKEDKYCESCHAM